jgi:hypothetical protein
MRFDRGRDPPQSPADLSLSGALTAFIRATGETQSGPTALLPALALWWRTPTETRCLELFFSKVIIDTSIRDHRDHHTRVELPQRASPILESRHVLRPPNNNVWRLGSEIPSSSQHVHEPILWQLGNPIEGSLPERRVKLRKRHVWVPLDKLDVVQDSPSRSAWPHENSRPRSW